MIYRGSECSVGALCPCMLAFWLTHLRSSLKNHETFKSTQLIKIIHSSRVYSQFYLSASQETYNINKHELREIHGGARK